MSGRCLISGLPVHGLALRHQARPLSSAVQDAPNDDTLQRLEDLIGRLTSALGELEAGKSGKELNLEELKLTGPDAAEWTLSAGAEAGVSVAALRALCGTDLSPDSTQEERQRAIKKVRKLLLELRSPGEERHAPYTREEHLAWRRVVGASRSALGAQLRQIKETP